MGVIVWGCVAIVFAVAAYFGFAWHVVAALVGFAAGLHVGLDDDPRCSICNPGPEDLG